MIHLNNKENLMYFMKWSDKWQKFSRVKISMDRCLEDSVEYKTPAPVYTYGIRPADLKEELFIDTGDGWIWEFNKDEWARLTQEFIDLANKMPWSVTYQPEPSAHIVVRFNLFEKVMAQVHNSQVRVVNNVPVRGENHMGIFFLPERKEYSLFVRKLLYNINEIYGGENIVNKIRKELPKETKVLIATEVYKGKCQNLRPFLVEEE